MRNLINSPIIKRVKFLFNFFYFFYKKAPFQKIKKEHNIEEITINTTLISF